MREFTKEELHNIYTKAYEVHLNDITFSVENQHKLFGMCDNLKDIIEEVYDIVEYDLKLLKDFMKLKPKGMTISDYWWEHENTSLIRIDNYKHLIDITT
jgi:hypothetical protein